MYIHIAYIYIYIRIIYIYIYIHTYIVCIYTCFDVGRPLLGARSAPALRR